MADRRRQRKRPESSVNNEELEKPEKVEYEIAKYLRSNLPPKQTTLLGHKVDYFIASRAIDLLMNSKWAQSNKRNDEVMFPSRESVTNFMNVMLRHKFFHRAKAIIVKKEIKKKQDTDSTDEGTKCETKKMKNVSEKSNKNVKEQSTTSAEKMAKKEKKKVKLDMHMEQIFVDANEPYVWIYDYIPMRTWLIGGGLVIAAIAICLFPLWPRIVRNYVYYLSIAVAVFLFFIIALALLKLVVFAIVWALTFGRHHLWILPNLTEDVGFFESFWPLYKHEYKSNRNKDNIDDDGDNTDEKGPDIDSMNNMDECKPIKNKGDNEETDGDDDDDENGEDDENCNEDSDNNIDDDSNTTNVTPCAKNTNGFEILDSNECDEN
ncbi:Translocation protein S62 [Dermatophagoides farinae]|uniref:Translocation protein SEC62 n=1 Tax=Dermatophagoides farinae TaxID=6954 RepID=A0A922IE71_DERFA|nr:Translocation protein S62 [Dermatophagoides farinae]